jgi:hypothetical protein
MPKFLMPNRIVPLPLTYWPLPKRHCGGGGDYRKESIGRLFSVRANFDSRGTQTLCFDDAQRLMRPDKSIILHKVLTQCPFVTQQDELLEVCL